MEVSCIVPVHNRANLVGECLRRLDLACREAMDGGVSGAEILVVDDGSTDASTEVVEQVARGCTVPVRLVRLSHRSGPAVARNHGVRAAKGELIIFVDSDVLVTRRFVQAHATIHESAGPSVYVVGALRTVADLAEVAREERPGPWDVSTNPLDTANASVRLDHLLQVGLFDEAFNGYGWEDIDLGLRLQSLGLRKIKAPQALAYHVKPPVRSHQELQRLLALERERARLAHVFLRKHPTLTGRWTVQASRAHLALNWLLRGFGLVHAGNVLRWAEWARRRRLGALCRLWLSGVLTQEYLRQLHHTP